MNQHTPHQPHHSSSEDDEPRPRSLTVEPDKGDTPPEATEDATGLDIYAPRP